LLALVRRERATLAISQLGFLQFRHATMATGIECDLNENGRPFAAASVKSMLD
jgi:hypothetical protein